MPALSTGGNAMTVKITKAFRIREEGGQRDYVPGDSASGTTAEWAVRHGYGQKAAPAPKNKAARPVRNKGD